MTIQFAPLWNNSTLPFTCIKGSVTDTGSDATSTLIDILVNGTSKFKVDKNGIPTFGGAYSFPSSDGAANSVLSTNGSGVLSFQDVNSTSFLTNFVPYTGATGAVNLGSNSLTTSSNVTTVNGSFYVQNGSATNVGRISQFNNSLYIDTLQNGAIFFRTGFGTSSPFTLSGDGITGGASNNLIDIHYGTTSQTLRLYTTYTSTTNGEYLQVRGMSAANFELGPSNGSAGGTLRGLTIGGYTNGSSTITPWLTFDNAGAATFASSALVTGALRLPTDNVGIYFSATGNTSARISTFNTHFYIDNVTAGGSTRFRVNVGLTNALTLANTGAATFANNVTASQYNATAGTITSSTPGINLTQTWNSGATTFTGALINVTDTASASASLLQDWQVGGTSLVRINKAGTMTFANYGAGLGAQQLAGPNWWIYSGGTFQSPLFNCNGWFGMVDGTAGGMQFFSGHGIVWSGTGTSGTLVRGSLTGDVGLYRDGAGILGLRYSTTAQTFRVYNTYTSATNFESLLIQWNTNEARIGTAVGSGGGSQRNIILGGWDSTSTWIPRIVITPTSTGAIYFGPVADSTTTGGNARGVRAIDFQVVRSNANQVASGDYSLILQGQNNRVANGYNWGTIVNAVNSTVTGASGLIVSGSNCTASNVFSVVVSGNQQTSSGQQSFIGNGGYLVASGTYSFIGNGDSSTASANYAFIGIGQTCTASAQYTDITSGLQTVADRYGMSAKAVGCFSAAGDAQSVRFILRIKTTDATATTMMLDGSATRLTIPSGKMMFADIWISGIKSDGSAAATYRRKVAIKNVGGTTSLIGAVETIGTDYEDNINTDIAITADNTNDALQINVTGITAETWRWVAVVEGLEIAYGV